MTNVNLTAIEIEMQEMIQKLDIPVVKSFSKIRDITQFIANVQNQTSIEGYVLRFDNGHMLKFKTSEYCLLHNSKEVASSEHNIVQAIIEEKIDDLKSLLIKEDLERVEEIEKRFWIAVQAWSDIFEERYNHYYHASSGDRKRFALEFAPTMDNKDEVGIIFGIWAGKSPAEVVLQWIAKNASKKMKYEEFSRVLYRDM